MRKNTGKFVINREIFESDIWEKPPYYLKVWVWVMGNANWKTVKKGGKTYRRGEFKTSFQEIIEANRWNSGYRKEKLTKDRDLKQIEYLIENTEETLEKRILTEDYLNCLEQKTEYLVLEKHIESEYFEKIKNIAELSEELENTDTDDATDEFILGGAIDLGPSLTNDNDPSVEGANFVLSDPAQSYGMDSCLPTMELLHNSNGEIYIPELGWVPESEYGWIEDILENLVLEGISEFLEVAGLILILASYYIFPVASAICAIIGMILQEIGLSGSFWIGLANLFVNLMIFGMIFGAALILIGLLLETISQETNTDP